MDTTLDFFLWGSGQCGDKLQIDVRKLNYEMAWPQEINEFSSSERTFTKKNQFFSSKPRLLNLIVRWPMGAAIVRPPNTEYTQSIGACWEKLPKIVKITLLQFNYEFGHRNFFTVWSSQYFQNIYRRKKISIDGNSHNIITKLRQVPCFRDVCLFSIQMKPFNHYNSNLSKTEGRIPQIVNIMAALGRPPYY